MTQLNVNARQKTRRLWPPDTSEDLILLDSASGGGNTLLFRKPLEIIRAFNARDLPECLVRLDAALESGLYVAGYLDYEAFFPPEAGILPGQSSSPLLWFGLFDEVETNPILPDTSGHFNLKRINADEESERADYLTGVHVVREELRKGNAYQVNLTQEIQFDFQGDPLALYHRLRKLQPAAYSAFLSTEDRHILSFSPELFFRLYSSENGGLELETRPVKGTSPRGHDSTGDLENLKQLGSDEKLLAENLMITDLLRNDLGKIALPGSVQVPDLFALETLPTLHQMYSVIRGAIPEQVSERLFQNIIPALFPCGSITGAPKMAAQKVIRNLENRRRGIYTGAIGFAAPQDNPLGLERAVFNVAIRTLEINRLESQARFGSGGGLVWDSVPELEWEECKLKRAFLLSSLDDFRVLETMRYENGRILFLREHLSRLRATLRHYCIRPASGTLRRIILDFMKVERTGAWKLRLTVSPSGALELGAEMIPEAFGHFGTRPFRLGLSERRIWSGDPFKRFKTTERGLYTLEFSRARAQGLDDMLFLNEKDEVAETCTNNLLLLNEAGEWLTPDTTSGALPGTYLQYLDRKHPGRIKRSKMKLQDIASTKYVFVCNSVRGLRRVHDIQNISGKV